MILMTYSLSGSRHCGRTTTERCSTPTGSFVGSTQCWESVLIHSSSSLLMSVKTCSSITCKPKLMSRIKPHLTTGLWRWVNLTEGEFAFSYFFFFFFLTLWLFLFFIGWHGQWNQSDWWWWEEFLLSILVWHRVCPLWDASQDCFIWRLQVQVSTTHTLFELHSISVFVFNCIFVLPGTVAAV